MGENTVEGIESIQGNLGGKSKLLPYYRNFGFCEIMHKHRKDWRDYKKSVL